VVGGFLVGLVVLLGGVGLVVRGGGLVCGGCLGGWWLGFVFFVVFLVGLGVLVMVELWFLLVCVVFGCGCGVVGGWLVGVGLWWCFGLCLWLGWWGWVVGGLLVGSGWFWVGFVCCVGLGLLLWFCLVVVWVFVLVVWVVWWLWGVVGWWVLVCWLLVGWVGVFFVGGVGVVLVVWCWLGWFLVGVFCVGWGEGFVVGVVWVMA
ncbi:hypothetical protein, partial [Neisseria sp. P0021.S004]|uniref:hypothetical protein n=1 Tax=Neisseria sp. P0021.S004 TaxID=3436819 RepID=UPI003F81EC1F